MKKIFDMHTHTKFSADSEVEPEVYCAEAATKGLDGLCFTDHIDLNPINPKYYEYYKPQAFFMEYPQLKEKYAARLELLCGIEISEPHACKDKFPQYLELPYDFVLGGIHSWYNDMCVGERIKAQVPMDLSYKLYWDAVLATVQTGGFDCLAHIDFPKRYYGELLFDAGKIQEIFSELLKKNICIEINTSAIRRGKSGTMPDKELLSIYKDMGGEFVTVGSDSHKAGDLAADFSRAKELIAYFGLKEIIFRQRKPFLV